MNPWLLVCLVACFAVAWAPTVHAQGAFEDCCLAYHHRVRLSWLRQAQSYYRQDVSGSCNLPAVMPSLWSEEIELWNLNTSIVEV